MMNRVTIADVARAAGVSPQTVSRAINAKGEIRPETRAQILAVVERLGYRPSTLARGLVAHKSFTLGLVVPDIANPFFSEVARGAEEVAHDAGYVLLLYNAIEDPGREVDAFRTLEAQRVDGVLLCSSRLPDAELRARATKFPAAVLMNRALPDSGLSSVSVDDEAGARHAVQHLLDSGRRAIAFLAGPPASRSGARRARGYQRALAEADIRLDPDLSLSCAPHLEGGRDAARALFSRHPRIDGLLCYNDLVAVGALHGCAELGRRVPEDVAVVGCDDIALAALVTPALTTSRSDKRRLGAEAARLLLAQVGGCGTDCEDIVLQPELIVRASAPAAAVGEVDGQ